ncbi:hypothetical protein A3D81_00425 [Candidatus Curtissbacteria bacterium RIFCSPHIGHO2_02_FULL_40_17]|uniref:Uncharacterized protein n=2 Tax=Microgenomates group TaxID=1794810 RepID=A0A1F5GGF6_9BACT|nr:MAG: hypothetical protein A3D81_00425 [Candidatus Curtissbacteria bacterium RIFCSPHIGHO2_02_FULL_40_17]OGK37584.1 MAG: hypothetical protein A3F32_01010 [Candidatus Roizmanbacteria bacterium RIFCSPHIGHO2_12_FULL_42_10]
MHDVFSAHQSIHINGEREEENNGGNVEHVKEHLLTTKYEAKAPDISNCGLPQRLLYMFLLSLHIYQRRHYKGTSSRILLHHQSHKNAYDHTKSG